MFKKKKRKEKVNQNFGLESSKDVFVWSNNPEYEEQLVKEHKKSIKKSDSKEVKIRVTPKEISSYFEVSKSKSKKSKRNNKALNKKDLKASELRIKTSELKIEKDFKNQKVFRYNKKKYTKVEDFITYLNEHYLDIEKISKELLDNEDFFGWINKNSGMFNQSLKEYKEIIAKIENKS